MSINTHNQMLERMYFATSNYLLDERLMQRKRARFDRALAFQVCGTDAIPVSLAQTIRAANPLFVVLVTYLYSGKK